MKRDISTREDIEHLIDAFYEKVIESEEIGQFFSEAIKNWDHHKNKFINYWCKQVLFLETYEGSPLRRHIDVDHKFNNSFKPQHFKLWFTLFEETVNELFEGPKAKLAKAASKNMAKNIYLQMFIGRHPDPLTI